MRVEHAAVGFVTENHQALNLWAQPAALAHLEVIVDQNHHHPRTEVSASPRAGRPSSQPLHEAIAPLDVRRYGNSACLGSA